MHLRLILAVLTVWPLLPAVALAQPATAPTILAAELGFDGVYKLGCWTPLVVKLQGGTRAVTGQLTVTAPDSDGVPTTVVAPRPVEIEPGQVSTVRLRVRVGQVQSSLAVRFQARGEILSERVFYVGRTAGDGMIPGGLPATERILLQLGPSLGAADLLPSQAGQQPRTRIVQLADASQLPTHWIGYEGVETLLLTTSDPRQYRTLQQNNRAAALRAWIERGGRVAVFCGAHGEELLTAGGPLAGLVPGSYDETVMLRQSDALENYCEVDEPVTRNRRLGVPATRLAGVRGQILLAAGQGDARLPLVVRARMGLGQTLFVGLDFDVAPLCDWSARPTFLRRALGWPSPAIPAEDNAHFGRQLQTDLSAQLREALDEKFAGVGVISFGVVSFLVLVYIFLIGPGDYFLVTKVLGRAELTWITFPLIVCGVSAAAYWYAHWMKGDQLRVNQVEIIDVDTRSGMVRGTAWTHVFAPRVSQWNLSFQPHYAGGPIASQQWISWLGKPGTALGGMQTAAAQTQVWNAGYSSAAELDALYQVPVPMWSTKTLTARWTATSTATIDARLERREEQLLGQLTNRTGRELEDCHLLFGEQSYYLGRLVPEKTVRLDGSQQPRRAKLRLTSATAGDISTQYTADDGTVPFTRTSQQDVARLLKVMMFYEALDGLRYTKMFHRYQAFIDLSYLLQQPQLAILLCRVPGPGSHWQEQEKRLASDQDRSWIYYRFLLEVGGSAADL